MKRRILRAFLSTAVILPIVAAASCKIAENQSDRFGNKIIGGLPGSLNGRLLSTYDLYTDLLLSAGIKPSAVIAYGMFPTPPYQHELGITIPSVPHTKIDSEFFPSYNLKTVVGYVSDGDKANLPGASIVGPRSALSDAAEKLNVSENFTYKVSESSSNGLRTYKIYDRLMEAEYIGKKIDQIYGNTDGKFETIARNNRLATEQRIATVKILIANKLGSKRALFYSWSPLASPNDHISNLDNQRAEQFLTLTGVATGELLYSQTWGLGMLPPNIALNQPIGLGEFGEIKYSTADHNPLHLALKNQNDYVLFVVPPSLNQEQIAAAVPNTTWIKDFFANPADSTVNLKVLKNTNWNSLGNGLIGVNYTIDLVMDLLQIERVQAPNVFTDPSRDKPYAESLVTL